MPLYAEYVAKEFGTHIMEENGISNGDIEKMFEKFKLD
jgi:hypothetical protein